MRSLAVWETYALGRGPGVQHQDAVQANVEVRGDGYPQLNCSSNGDDVDVKMVIQELECFAFDFVLVSFAPPPP